MICILRCMINCVCELYSQVYNNADFKMINDPRGESEQCPWASQLSEPGLMLSLWSEPSSSGYRDMYHHHHIVIVIIADTGLPSQKACSQVVWFSFFWVLTVDQSRLNDQWTPSFSSLHRQVASITLVDCPTRWSLFDIWSSIPNDQEI